MSDSTASVVTFWLALATALAIGLITLLVTLL